MEVAEQQPRQAAILAIKSIASHQYLPVRDEEQVLYVLTEIAARPATGSSRRPFNLCLVLDRSTSMQGARLQRVKEATHFIIDSLGESDVFSVVIFSDRAEVLIPAQVRMDKATAKARVSTIRSMGGTEILQGMTAGLEQIESHRAPGLVNHLIFLTDGQTYGGELECLAQADEAGRRQIGISTMGIGQEWNDKLLDEIAARSGGTSTYIDTTAKVVSVFRERIHALTTVVAQSASLHLSLPAGVRLREAFRVSPRLEQLRPQEGQLNLGPLNSEQSCVLILELALERALKGSLRVAQLELCARVPDVVSADEAGEWTPEKQEICLDATIDVELVTESEKVEPVPPNIVSALGKLAIFKMQEKTMRDLERGEIDRASQRLETMATRLLNIGENELAKAALLEAGRLARTGHLSAEGRKKIRYGTRGLSMLPKEISRG